MAIRLPIAVLLCLALTACSDRKSYERISVSIDSLSARTGAVQHRLGAADTARVAKALALYHAYRDFLVAGYKDTLDVRQGEALARFEAAGQQLEAFVKNRRLLIARAGEVNEQLSALAHDASEKAIGVEMIDSHLRREKREVERFSVSAEKELAESDKALQRMDSAIVLIRQIIAAAGKN
jgi:hypothetical protein